MTIKRCYPVLVGASVGENQLLTNLSSRAQTLGITITANNDGSITASGTATADNNLWFKQNFPFMANRVYLLKGSQGNGYLRVSGSYSGRDTGGGCLYKFSSNNSLQIVYGFSANTTYNETLFPEIIDLTLKLGSAIADYIYSLESATAGSGIAWLRSYGFLTDDYVPYNAGTLESVEATAKVVRDENGENAVNYTLGSDVLRGLFKLDANNKLYADGDRKEADGTITRKYGIVDLGTLTWTYSDNIGFRSNALYPAKFKGMLICSKYLSAVHPDYPISTWNDKTIGVGNSQANPFVFVVDSAYSDAQTFTTAMDGVMLVYELATPATEQGDPFPSPQVCYPDGTESFVTETGVPVGHETKYQL